MFDDRYRSLNGTLYLFDPGVGGIVYLFRGEWLGGKWLNVLEVLLEGVPVGLRVLFPRGDCYLEGAC